MPTFVTYCTITQLAVIKPDLSHILTSYWSICSYLQAQPSSNKFRVQMASSLPTVLLIAFATAQVAFATYANYPPCDPPHSPDYGGYGPIKTKYHVGSKIKYYCNDGYRRHGALWNVCRYNNKKSYWAYQTPVCKRKLLHITVERKY